MEKRLKLLREQLDRDIATANQQPQSPTAKAKWSFAQRQKIEADVEPLNLPDDAQKSVVASCLLHRHTMDGVFDGLIQLETDGAKSALLKKLRLLARQSFEQVFTAIIQTTKIKSEQPSAEAENSGIQEARMAID